MDRGGSTATTRGGLRSRRAVIYVHIFDNKITNKSTAPTPGEVPHVVVARGVCKRRPPAAKEVIEHSHSVKRPSDVVEVDVRLPALGGIDHRRRRHQPAEGVRADTIAEGFAATACSSVFECTAILMHLACVCNRGRQPGRGGWRSCYEASSEQCDTVS